MRKNFGAQTWLYPMPVLIVGTYDENGVPDAMNAAWDVSFFILHQEMYQFYISFAHICVIPSLSSV